MNIDPVWLMTKKTELLEKEKSASSSTQILMLK